MDTSNIPKTFWHSLSVAVLACTAMLLVIAYRSTDVSIRIANARVDLKRSVAEVEGLNKELEAEYERLKAAGDRLDEKYEEIASMAERETPVSREELRKIAPAKIHIRKTIIPPERFKTTDQHLQRALRRLD